MLAAHRQADGLPSDGGAVRWATPAGSAQSAVGARSMFTKFLAIAHNTFTETIRQPVYGLILLVTAGMMYSCIAFAGFSLDDDDKLLKEFGLSTLLMGGLFLAAFSAAGILAGEIENKTVLTVISKPIGRALFILGKFLGLVAALTIAF
jgi:ABC-2 type transport system permease protein